MICSRCGTYVARNEIVCPVCGAPADHTAKEEGLQAIRQGKHVNEIPVAAPAPVRRRRGSSRDAGAAHTLPESAATPIYFDADRIAAARAAEDTQGLKRPTHRAEDQIAAEAGNASVKGKARGIKLHTVTNHMINWVHMTVAGVAVLMLLLVGAYFYLTRSMNGQLILARSGFDTSSEALWQVGQEAMDIGSVDKAIQLMEMAAQKDGDLNANVDGLLQLAGAYEASGDTLHAMELYRHIYTDLATFRSEAYRSMIRLLLAAGKDAEAADLMKTAYETTGLTTFREQRNVLLPPVPVVDTTAGTFATEKDIHLTAREDDQIYYTLNDTAVLPDEGILYESGIHLAEGVYTLRAVSVNDGLVSDPLAASYKIIMPTPQKPNVNLAPGEYNKPKKVNLRLGDDDRKAAAKAVRAGKQPEKMTIYYTVDGSIPNTDSPIYTGEKIALPNGNKVTINAIVYNAFGKASNMMSVSYKITAKPYPLNAYELDDTIGGYKLNQTTRAAFEEKEGKGKAAESVSIPRTDIQAERVTYDWGTATFIFRPKGWMLQGITLKNDHLSAPRETHIGMTEAEIVAKYRDLGQLVGPTGKRGLYYSKDGVYGRIEPTDTGKTITYSCYSVDSKKLVLIYTLDASGSCTEISWTYSVV